MELVTNHLDLSQKIELRTIFYAHERHTRDSEGFFLGLYQYNS